jgi:large conductance mechanosensitive channel
MRPSVRIQSPGWMTEFKDFVMRGNVVDLAVGIIIGAAFTNVFVTIKGPNEATLEAAQKAGAVTLNIGLFLNAVLQFLIVAFAIFWVVKTLNRFKRKEQALSEPVPAPPPRAELLLEEIRDAIRAKPSAP